MSPVEESFNPQIGHDPLAENHCSKGHPQPCKTGEKSRPRTNHYCPLQRETPTELSLPSEQKHRYESTTTWTFVKEFKKEHSFHTSTSSLWSSRYKSSVNVCAKSPCVWFWLRNSSSGILSWGSNPNTENVFYTMVLFVIVKCYIQSRQENV